jgi:hypothetical protein
MLHFLDITHIFIHQLLNVWIFPFLVILNRAAMNIHAPVFVWANVFFLLGINLGGKFLAQVETMLNYLKNWYFVFQNDYTTLQSHQQYMRVPFFLHPCQYLLSFSLVIACLMGVKWYLNVFLIIFAWWQMMLSIFSCSSWLTVYLLCRNVCSDHLLNFNWVICLFIIDLK